MKRQKYNAKRVTVDGITFDSQAEHRRWCELKLLERAGEIQHLERQVPIILHGAHGPLLSRKTKRPRKMVIDFRYMTKQRLVYEDTKGMMTPEWSLKADILMNMSPNTELRISGRKS
jgi:hypothetical protein